MTLNINNEIGKRLIEVCIDYIEKQIKLKNHNVTCTTFADNGTSFIVNDKAFSFHIEINDPKYSLILAHNSIRKKKTIINPNENEGRLLKILDDFVGLIIDLSSINQTNFQATIKALLEPQVSGRPR